MLLCLLTHVPWRQRVRHGLIYGALVVTLLMPYLVFIEVHGGVVSYFRNAAAWAQQDRNRAPVVWPGLFDNPDGVSPEAQSGGVLRRAVATVQDNSRRVAVLRRAGAAARRPAVVGDVAAGLPAEVAERGARKSRSWRPWP